MNNQLSAELSILQHELLHAAGQALSVQLQLENKYSHSDAVALFTDQKCKIDFCATEGECITRTFGLNKIEISKADALSAVSPLAAKSFNYLLSFARRKNIDEALQTNGELSDNDFRLFAEHYKTGPSNALRHDEVLGHILIVKYWRDNYFLPKRNQLHEHFKRVKAEGSGWFRLCDLVPWSTAKLCNCKKISSLNKLYSN